MSYRVEDIAYERGSYWVLKVPTGYEVYRTGITHSTRVARIGWPGEQKGLDRAIAEIDRREAQDSARQVGMSPLLAAPYGGH